MYRQLVAARSTRSHLHSTALSQARCRCCRFCSMQAKRAQGDEKASGLDCSAGVREWLRLLAERHMSVHSSTGLGRSFLAARPPQRHRHIARNKRPCVEYGSREEPFVSCVRWRGFRFCRASWVLGSLAERRKSVCNNQQGVRIALPSSSAPPASSASSSTAMPQRAPTFCLEYKGLRHSKPPRREDRSCVSGC